jgi:D-alanine-D-alanine ligase-like ATP-grasp enzyme
MEERSGMAKLAHLKVSVLFQAVQPPLIDGVRKPMKPGGYSDSGADIASTLRKRGIHVITPASNPSEEKVLDWVFPDTSQGILEAISKGANVLWTNTILFNDHPITKFADQGIQIVGQHWETTQKYDDKWVTNEELRAAGLNVVPSVLISAKKSFTISPTSSTNGSSLHEQPSGEIELKNGSDSTRLAPRVICWASVSREGLSETGLVFPLVVKPVRGRGSQGVFKVDDFESLKTQISHLLAETEIVEGQNISVYGEDFIVEQFMAGQEVTVTVMPPGDYQFGALEGVQTKSSYWCLPIIKRFNHIDRIAPYNGTVAVTSNSSLLDEREGRDKRFEVLCKDCEVAASLVQAKAPIRIDCRSSVLVGESPHEQSDGPFYLFDLNMKPNMTGPGRPGRETQDSLCAMAARGTTIRWDFGDFLLNMLSQHWLAK